MVVGMGAAVATRGWQGADFFAMLQWWEWLRRLSPRHLWTHLALDHAETIHNE